jgi:hypothetical protein
MTSDGGLNITTSWKTLVRHIEVSGGDKETIIEFVEGEKSKQTEVKPEVKPERVELSSQPEEPSLPKEPSISQPKIKPLPMSISSWCKKDLFNKAVKCGYKGSMDSTSRVELLSFLRTYYNS